MCAQVALDKLYNFVTRGVYETKLAGVALAGMCRRMCKNHPALSFFKFFDVFYRNLITTLDSTPARSPAGRQSL